MSLILPSAGSHFISLEKAIEMTSHFRINREAVLSASAQKQDILPICETFNRADIEALLAKKECAGLRIYFGMDESLKIRVVIIGVNAEAKDLLPQKSSVDSGTVSENVIIEEGHRCPPACPDPSLLNS